MLSDQMECILSILVYHPETYKCECSICKSQFVIQLDLFNSLEICPWCKRLIGEKQKVEIGQI
jgi:hypothetical protein